MKKILALVLSLAMVLSFAGCGKKDEGETSTEEGAGKIYGQIEGVTG